MIRSSVDLPLPFGPIRPVVEPSGRRTRQSFSAQNSSARDRNSATGP
jgi:hypothetical protein